MAVVLALAETWPLPMHATTAFPGHAPHVTEATSDHLLIAWILASDVRRFRQDPLGVFETNNMHPFRTTLAYSENLLGMAAVVWPVQVWWDDPVLTANVALMVVIALSAYGVILLAHELTGSVVAALVAALLATYAPWVWSNVSQIHAVAGQSTSLALFALARLVRTRAWRFVGLLGCMTAWQAWASLHWGLFLAIGLVATVLCLLLVSGAARRALPRIALAGVLAGLLVVPLALPYAAVARDMDLGDRGFVMGVYKPWKVLPNFVRPLEYLGDRLADGSRSGQRLTLTPWLLVGLALLTAPVGRRRGVVWIPMALAVAAGGIANLWYAMGPVEWFGVPSLYAWLAHVPGLGVVRSPARGVAYASLCAGVLGGCALAAVLARLPWRAARAGLVATVVCLAVVEGGWHAGGLAAAPARRLPMHAAFAKLPADCAVAELPTSFERQAAALFESTAHWRPVVNGRSGFYPISPLLEGALLNGFPQEESIRYLQDAGACAVVLHTRAQRGMAMLKASRLRQMRPRVIAPFTWLVRLPPAEDEPEPPVLGPAGIRILEPPGAHDALLDGSLATRYELDAVALERLVIDLGAPATVSGIDLALGRYFRRYLRTYRIEASSDGESWSTVAKHGHAAPPIGSYRADPTRIVQRLRFPEVRTRFLRVGPARRPKGGYSLDAGFASWSPAEVTVRGVRAR